ncbi:MAG: 50S ribosomal protein L30 [Fidelibacterota bacterium]
MAKKKESKLRITQVKSPIGHNKKFRKTLEALGLRRLHHTVEHADNPVIRGMIKKIDFLLKVEEIS